MRQPKPVLVEISPGELFDKITVLEVKVERIKDRDKLANVRIELSVLREARESSIEECPELQLLVDDLRAVNDNLYDVIDGIYACEASGDTWERFVGLARSVYRLLTAGKI